MINIEKLNRMLDEALAAESVESLTLWMEEQIRADREAGIIRNADFDILHLQQNSGINARQEAVIETGVAEYVAYSTSSTISHEFDTTNINDYNLAA